MSWRKTIVSSRLIDMGHFLEVTLGGVHLHTFKEKSVHIILFDSTQQDVITYDDV